LNDDNPITQPAAGTSPGSRVLAVVVNWRLAEETLPCLESLLESGLRSDILVVDNESTADSRAVLGSCDPRIDVVASPVNLGFGAACNRAFAGGLRSEHDYVFLVNNDATVAPDALEWLVRRADEDPTTGILGAKVYYRDAPNTIWFAGARRRQGVLAATGFGRNEVDVGQFDSRRRVDYVFGTAMLIRRSVLDRVGGFDEQFFLYLEDLDLCLRTQSAGHHLLFVPEARVWHAGSASTSRDVARRRYHMARSTVLFLHKHTSILSSLPIMTFWVAVYLRDILRDLWRGDNGTVRSCLAGIRAGLMGVLSMTPQEAAENADRAPPYQRR